MNNPIAPSQFKESVSQRMSVREKLNWTFLIGVILGVALGLIWAGFQLDQRESLGRQFLTPRSEGNDPR